MSPNWSQECRVAFSSLFYPALLFTIIFRKEACVNYVVDKLYKLKFLLPKPQILFCFTVYAEPFSFAVKPILRFGRDSTVSHR